MKNKEVGNKYKNILKKMDYGSNFEKESVLIKEWLQEYPKFILKENNTNVVEIKNILSGEILTHVKTISDIKPQEYICELNALKKSEIFLKLCKEILSNVDLICELEMVTRGILIKDTKSIATSHIISHLKYYVGQCYDKNIKQVVRVHIHDNFFLGNLSIYFGMLLYDGCVMQITVEPQMILTAALFKKICTSAGIPDNMITIIPTLPANFEKDKLIEPSKIPMIIMNNADIDSACLSAMEGIWGYKGNLQWSINRILVQEDIIEEFLKKFENLITKMRFTSANDKLADFSLPVEKSALEKLNNIIKNAALLGIKVIQPLNLKTFQPTIFVGGLVYDNNVLSTNECAEIPYVTVLPFRNTTEAIHLANNCKQNSAATIWTENIGTAYNVAKKLIVKHVWINSYGLHKNVPHSYYCYKVQTPPKELPNWEKIKKDQEVWEKHSYEERVEKLFQLHQVLDNEVKKSNNYKKDEIENLKLCLNILQSSIRDYSLPKTPIPCTPDYLVTMVITPRKVVFMEFTPNDMKEQYKFLFNALLHGNAVILLDNYAYTKYLTKDILNKCNIPAHLLEVVDTKNENIIKKHFLQSNIAFKYDDIFNFCNVKYICLNC